jgi:hypothetical protein
MITSYLIVHIARADGGFQPGVYFPTDHNAAGLALADFNADSLTDAAVVAWQNNTLSIFTGNTDCDDCPADYNDDGLVNFSDFHWFLDRLANTYPDADLNTDGQTNFFDLIPFMHAFNTGCP